MPAPKTFTETNRGMINNYLQERYGSEFTPLTPEEYSKYAYNPLEKPEEPLVVPPPTIPPEQQTTIPPEQQTTIPPEQQTTIPSSSTPLTYGEWVTSQREQIEANRKQSVIDAQSSYMKNLSTYGANKDRLASSGLTNSGYGEYLTSRAYTQMRDDVQAAKRLATDANLTLSAQELEHNEALKTKYAQYLTDIANGAYSDANIAGAMGKALGLTAEQTTTGKNMVTDQAVSGFYNAISAGKLNTSEVDKIKDTIDPTVYADLQAKWNESWKIDDNTFIGAKGKLSYKDAKAFVDEICNNPWASEPTKTALQNALRNNYYDEFLAENSEKYIKKAKTLYKGKEGEEPAIEGKIVDVTYNGYESSQWGNYTGINNPNSEQGKYLASILADEEAGKIPEGSIVQINYGSAGRGVGTYMYLGDGVFIDCYPEYFSETVRQSYYIPDGYKLNSLHRIKKE